MFFIIVPYSMYGGAEVYLINTYIHHLNKDKVIFVVNSKNEKFINKIKNKYNYITFSNQNDLMSKLLSYNLEHYDITFYNSKSIYFTLDELKKIKKNVFIREIIHSELIYPDSSLTIQNKKVDDIIVVSETVARRLRLKGFKVIRPTIDESRFKNCPKNKDPENIIIGMVCRISPEKNIPRALSILNLLPEKYKLKIIGHDCGDKDRVIKFIQKYKLEKRVIIKDYTDEIEKEYATFDIFMLTSLVEGFPITILEAIASGLPVIAPNVGGICELKEVILFNNSDDDNSIARKILNIKIDKNNNNINNIKTEKRDIDFLFVGGCDRNTNFHNLDILAKILALRGKKSAIIDANYSNLNDTYKTIIELLQKSKNLIIYRFAPVSDEIYKYCKHNNISIGFTVDDNIFNTTYKIPKLYQDMIKKEIMKADYCFSYNSVELYNCIKNINQNTYFIKNMHMYDFIYKQLNIIEPIKNTTDIIRIGLCYGLAHIETLNNTINYLKDLLVKINDKKFEIIAFHNAIFNITINNVTLKSIPFEKDIVKYYNKLHSLGLDVVFVEYGGYDIIKTKSDLKWRESAYMGVPLIAICPYKIYNITNFFNGFYYESRESFEKEAHIIFNKDILQRCGEVSKNDFVNRNPINVADDFLSMIKKINEKNFF